MITTVTIPGIHCPACAALIKDVSGDFAAIKRVDVDVHAKTVTIDHEPGFDMAQWQRDIEGLGETYRIQSAP